MADIITSLVEKLSNDLVEKYPSRLASLSSIELQQTLQSIIDSLIPASIGLSTSSPDYETVVFKLIKEIESSSAWTDTATSATGQMLLRLIASDIAYSQFSIGRALQESMTHTARSVNAIYENARSLGVRLERRIPASTTVMFTRQDTVTVLTVPAYQAFTINGEKYFNRTSFSFDENQLQQEVTLFQGEIFEESIASSGARYQDIQVGYENWAISDTDVLVRVDTVEYRRTTEPLFLFGPNDRVWYDSTLPTGNLEIKFGSGIYGASPVSGTTINVLWVETKGTNAHTKDADMDVTWDAAPSGVVMNGVTLSGTSDGRMQLPPEYYKVFAGDLRPSYKAAHRRADHRAHALKFPGVYDARFRGQAELGPDKPSLAMVVEATLLTDPPFTELQWNRFTAYFESAVPFKPLITRRDATVKELEIEADVYVVGDYDREEVKGELTAYITKAFEPDNESLGYSWYCSDIYDLVGAKDNNELKQKISYIVLKTPTSDTPETTIDSWTWVKLTKLTLNMYYSKREQYKGRID